MIMWDQIICLETEQDCQNQGSQTQADKYIGRPLKVNQKPLFEFQSQVLKSLLTEFLSFTLVISFLKPSKVYQANLFREIISSSHVSSCTLLRLALCSCKSHPTWSGCPKAAAPDGPALWLSCGSWTLQTVLQIFLLKAQRHTFRSTHRKRNYTPCPAGPWRYCGALWIHWWAISTVCMQNPASTFSG